MPPDQSFWDKFPRRELPDGASTRVNVGALGRHVELTRNKMTVSEFKRAEKTLKDLSEGAGAFQIKKLPPLISENARSARAGRAVLDLRSRVLTLLAF